MGDAYARACLRSREMATRRARAASMPARAERARRRGRRRGARGGGGGARDGARRRASRRGGGTSPPGAPSRPAGERRRRGEAGES